MAYLIFSSSLYISYRILIIITTLFLYSVYSALILCSRRFTVIIEKYLQIYNHILLYLQWVKKEKIKTEATIKPYNEFYSYVAGNSSGGETMASSKIARFLEP